MNISLDGIVLSNALSAITRIAPPAVGNITLKSDGKVFTLSSYSDAAYCSYTVPSESVSGEAEFCIPIDSFKSAIVKRKALSLKYENTTLKIASKNFQISLATSDAIAYDTPADKNVIEQWVITPEQGSWLKQAVKSCALAPTVINPSPALTIKLTDNNAFVCCYGEDHLAFTFSKEVKGKMEVTLPVDTILSILEVFAGQSFKMQRTENRLKVFNKLCRVSISLPAQEYLPVSTILDTARNANKSEGKIISLHKEEIINFLTNASALASKERLGIKFLGDASKLRLQIQSINGQCATVIKGNNDGINFDLDSVYFREAIDKCNEEVMIKWVQKDLEYVYIPTKTAHFLIATSQRT